ncbi:MAG: transposase [Verrucomicrobia bacterium]|nr:transposase [Verrucomicrobiota bacterium]
MLESTARISALDRPTTGRQTRRAKDRGFHFDHERATLSKKPTASSSEPLLENLNTHTIASLYETYPPAEAHRLAQRLEIHYTPKHGSWLNIAEIEFSALNSQCLRRRIPSIEAMRTEIAAWQKHRNNRGAPIDWHFTTQDARIKLTRLYPKL